MKFLKILLLLSIFFQFFENKKIAGVRNLEVEGSDNIDTEEPNTAEVSNSNDFPPFNGTSDSDEGSYNVPSHTPSSDSAEGSYNVPSHTPSSDSVNSTNQTEAETDLSYIVPTHAPGTTTTPTENEPTQSSGSGGSTSESSYDIPSHQNSTQSEVPIYSTYPYTPSTSKPKIILVGFGGFQKVETPPPSPGIATLFDIIIFRVYFKRYLYGTLFPFMRFHVDLTYSIFLRNLEEKEANCVKIRDIGEDIEYNCTVPDIEPNKTIEALASKNDYIFNDGEHDAPADESGFDFVQSSFANSTAGNIQKQTTTELSNSIVINSAQLNMPDPNKPSFEIVGYSQTPIDDEEVTFSFDEKGDGQLKNVTCKVVSLSQEKYQFNCETDKSLRVNINGAMGKSSSGKNVLLSFDKDAKGNYNDLLVINNPSNFYGKQYSSSAGLSGGAIAGIVIACVCALIAIGLISFFFTNKGNPAPMQETVMQMYSSNSNTNQDNL